MRKYSILNSCIKKTQEFFCIFCCVWDKNQYRTSNFTFSLRDMLLTITSPEQQLRHGHVEKVTIPTELGEITVLPGHQPLISVVRAGMMKISPQEMPAETHTYTIVDGYVMISVAKWLLSVTHDEIIITTAVGTRTTKESQEVLEQMHADMSVKIAEIKAAGNQEDLEDAIMNMEKITADLRIAKMSAVR